MARHAVAGIPNPIHPNPDPYDGPELTAAPTVAPAASPTPAASAAVRCARRASASCKWSAASCTRQAGKSSSAEANRPSRRRTMLPITIHPVVCSHGSSQFGKEGGGKGGMTECVPVYALLARTHAHVRTRTHTHAHTRTRTHARARTQRHVRTVVTLNWKGLPLL